MKYLLHIDTSSDTGTVAIGGDGVLLSSRANTETRNHASTLNNMIRDVLEDTKLALSDINAVVVCAGPGSYTGLRIGLATAKGLCYALDKPLLLDNRLALLAYQNYRERIKTDLGFITLLLAREKEYFASIHDENFTCTLSPQHINEEQLVAIIAENRNMQIITNVANETFNKLNINTLGAIHNIEINLVSWIFYAFQQYNCNNIVTLSTAEPFYLKQVYTHK